MVHKEDVFITGVMKVLPTYYLNEERWCGIGLLK